MRNDCIRFGKYAWQVLARKTGMALIITQDVIELHWYHQQFVDITWAECDLRNYLNHELYNQFSQHDKSKIRSVTLSNPDNPWFKTKGGKESLDRLFLLSLEEVCLYFGDSSAKLQHKADQTWLIDDANNSQRQARYGGDLHSWRLRSPGYYGRTAASVRSDGCVYVRGNGVYGRPRDGGGLRPALWLKLDT